MVIIAHITYYNPFRDEDVLTSIRLNYSLVVKTYNGDVVRCIENTQYIPHKWTLNNVVISGEPGFDTAAAG